MLEGEGDVDVLVDGECPPNRACLRASAPLHDRALPAIPAGLLELRFSPGLAGYAFTFG